MGQVYDTHAATALLNLGELRCKSGKWHLGVEALEEALPLHRRALGPRHIGTVYNLSRLGHAYLLTGQLDRAEAALTEALEIERERYPHDVLVGHRLLGLSLVRGVRSGSMTLWRSGSKGCSAPSIQARKRA
jgi:tetratricopeptide (TPR) repeat protein